MKPIKFILALILFSQLACTQTLPQGSVWKYLDDGSNQDTAWRYVSYNDSSWASGAAQLGYGDGDEVTTLSFGSNSSNKHITYYFRKTINISNPANSPYYTFKLLRDDGAVVYVNGQELFRSNMPSGTIGYQTLSAGTVSGSDESTYYEYSFPNSIFVQGNNLIAVEIHQRSTGSSDISFDLDVAPSQLIVAEGEVWKYLDNGSNQDTAWRFSSYNDSSWASGAAQLGYGDGDETTTLSYGSSSSNKYITTYFRKSFNVPNTSSASVLQLDILRDDGAVVYLNGVEIVRSNMPSGNISYATLAASTVGGANEDIFFPFNISSALLNQGNNILAVEIHQRSASSSDISFDLRLKFSSITYFRKAPYLLYPGENTKMLILWQLKDSLSTNIYWGYDTTYSLGNVATTEYGSDHQHKYTLTGLNPATKYYYKVAIDSNNFKTGSFITGVADTEQKVSFYAYGDTRTNPDKHNLVAGRVMSYVAQNPSSQSFIISSGDFVSNGNKEADWDNQFFDPQYTHLQDMLSNLPYVGVVGNHEGQGLLFAKYFPFPMFVTGRYYYSYDYGPVHFTVVDQFTNYSVGSTQYNWMVNDLATSQKPWKIILLHEPGWSAGGGHSNSSKVQNVIQPLCLSYGVQFVITGHNHYYARAEANGVEHITTGGGGAPLYNPNANADSIVTVDKSFHFCKLDIDHDTLHFSAIRHDGSIIETFDYHINTNTNLEKSKNVFGKNFVVFSSQNSIFIENKTDKSIQLEIYDSLGKRVRKESFKEKRITINMYHGGIYFVRLSVEGSVFVKKVFVE